MRKMILAALAAMVAGNAAAEIKFWDEGTPEKTVTYGARLGLNIANLGGAQGDWDAKSGLLLGAAVDWHLINSLSINTGLYFTMKGTKANYIIEGEGTNNLYWKGYQRYSYNALEIPVYLNYHFEVAPESQVQVFFGPYFDLGIYGKALNKVTEGNTTVETTTKMFDNGFRRFSCGVGLGAAYTWHACQIALQYQWGCNNVAKDVDGSWNNFSITLGYNFSL